VEAAYAVFAQRGYHATTIGDIAARWARQRHDLPLLQGQAEILDQSSTTPGAVRRGGHGHDAGGHQLRRAARLFQDTVQRVYDELAASPGCSGSCCSRRPRSTDAVGRRVLRLQTQARDAIAAYLGFARAQGIVRATVSIRFHIRVLTSVQLSRSRQVENSCRRA